MGNWKNLALGILGLGMTISLTHLLTKNSYEIDNAILESENVCLKGDTASLKKSLNFWKGKYEQIKEKDSVTSSENYHLRQDIKVMGLARHYITLDIDNDLNSILGHPTNFFYEGMGLEGCGAMDQILMNYGMQDEIWDKKIQGALKFYARQSK